MAPREELLLILDLTSTVLRAGVGVADLIRGPLLELPTRLGRKLNTKGSQVEDYLVGHYLSEAERTGPNEFEVVYPLQVDPKVGFIVTDWVGLEAIFRYAFHISLQLPRPPLLHPTVLSVPPSLPHSTTDSLHRLLFERLLVPSLLLSSRPFFAAGASGVTSGVILDIGWRGEGCEVSVVHDNQVYEAPGGSRVSWVDEGVLDDYCAVKIWEENRESLMDGFGKAQEEGKELNQGEILDGVRRIVGELKNRDLIGFKSKLYTPPVNLQALGDTVAGGEEDGQFDVAKVVAEGKVSEIVKKSKSKSSKSGTSTSEGDFVTIPNPFSPPPPPPQIDLTIPVAEIPEHANLSVGPARHLYLEPLFFPQVLSTTLTSTNEAAKEIGLTYFERIEVPKHGIQEVIGSVLTSIKDLEVKEAVCENLIVISSGRVASNRALGSTLLPLLSPYSSTPQQPDQALIDQAITPRGPMRYARTPEYFANFKEHAGDWGVYLGACIMGKLLIGDQQAKLFMSKAEYTQKGPAYYRQMEIIP